MNRSRPLLLAILAMAVLCWLPQPARAATTCTASTTPLAFGTVTGASNADTTAVVTITCNTTGLSLLSTIRVRMCLNIGAGANGGGLTTPRRMTNSFSDTMEFQIYSDPARSQIWGDRNIAATPNWVPLDLEYQILAVGGGGSTTVTLFGRVPAQAGLAAGAYSNPFTGSHTRLEYRYAEPIIGPPPFPPSCISGGTGGSTTTFTFTATATVPNSCTISNATALDFGSVAGTIAADRDQTSTLNVACTGRTAWNVGLDNGQHASGATRRMQLGTSGNFVNYELYRDAGRSQRWGTTIGTDTATGTGTGTAQTLTIHGRVPSTQAVPAGQYRDVVTATVTY